PVDTAYPVAVSLIALAVFAMLIALARFFQLTLRLVTRAVRRLLPARLSYVVAVVATLALFWLVINGLLFRTFLRVPDASFSDSEALIEPEREPPTAPLKTGSRASLLAWDKLGRAGREFITSGPTREDISVLSGRAALSPVRVYVGLRSANTPEER